MAKPLGYSRLQITLHWIVGVLIVFQLIFGEDIGGAYDALRDGGVPDMTLIVWGHIIAGVAILLLALWRLGLRASRGVPAPIAGQSQAQLLVGAAVVGLFYAIMIGAPITGLAAWYGGIETAGELHEMAKPVVIALIALHVLAALYHQFIKKDGLLMRMKQPLD